MKFVYRTSAVFLAAFVSLPALAEEGHRHVDAHEHGHGTVNIAIEGNRVDIELQAPGSDIVGFEHRPKTEAQTEKLKAAKAKLANVFALVKLDDGAGCNLTKSDVAFETEGHSEDVHNSKDDDHDAHDHDKNDAKKQDGDETSHAEFHALYQVECKDASKISSLVFGYFDAFGGAKELDVNVVTAKKQTKFEVTRDKPAINIVGMM